MIEIDSIGDAPWSRHDWRGEFISVDGASTADFARCDVASVVAYGDSGPGWDGESAGIVRLNDGRVIAWESDWGPTGSGFCCDAYGGDANIICAMTVGAALPHISEKRRELMKWNEERP